MGKTIPTSSESAIAVLRRKKQEKVKQVPVVIAADLKVSEEFIKGITGFELRRRLGNVKDHSNWEGTLQLRNLESAYKRKEVKEIRWVWHGREAKN